MLIVRYTAWDGSQQIRLHADQVFDKLAELLSYTDDVAQAFDWLLHQGLEWEPGRRVLGLDELLEQVREAMRRRYQDVNLRGAFAELRERLETLLELEREALDADADAERARRRRAALDALPLRVSEAAERLRDTALGDSEARAALAALVEDLDDIRDLEEFQRRYGDLFHGPQALSFAEAVALMRDIYQGLLRDRGGSHPTDHRGATIRRVDETLPYRYGDPFDLDLVATLKNALRRRVGTPLALHPDDFAVHAADHATTTSTVLLLDMSWSMSWEGRFAAAKKVAMAMESLIRARFPRDYFAIVGFFTRAVELKLRDLPEASWNMGDPFTNLQDGLRLAAELLARHPSHNQHVIVITDGQPTAYFLDGRLHCEWPLSFGGISMRAAHET